MSARRVMGIETEYGVSAPGDPAANAMLMSSQVVNAYAAPLGSRAGRARWDYEDEAPLRDARGWEITRESAHSSQLTDAPEDPGLANVILTNGARLYVDHAHPEYSSPEVTSPRDVVLWDKAGEQVMLEACRRIAANPGLGEVNLYKNNTDNKGASYGTHENYLMRRSTPFADVVRHLTPFFVTRQVFTGAGRVGRGQDGTGTGFQISQRADFFEVEVGLETTLKRPIINTRDEPHASADRFRRLHVIIGDANLCEVATLLKVGTTNLVLQMIEDAAFTQDLSVERPVGTLHDISHDPTLKQHLTLRDGRSMTAVELQWLFFEQASAYVADRYGDDADEATTDVLNRWESILTRLGQDPMLCARELDWVAKLRLLEGFRNREGLNWDAARLQLIDLQYADVRPEKGLYHRLLSRGQVERVVTDAEIAEAVHEPPHDTRAYFRGRCLARYGDNIAAASWDSVIFDIPGRGALQRVPTLDPSRGTREHVEALLQRCETAAELVDALAAE
ncbi:proteasome accessory factor PafA2 [Kineosporia rhizophila]|uniref:depupylase/deamidase Dop n=1 Tax=Kineosporia TaxID=49184 RepID=UPI001E5E4F81|nr:MULTISPECIES: depupylase/deamidase Dop [Kineosporia]MCE0538432.1 proteasome accessory factor PafA2 [Kineosporia rhizophila]GLY18284.1 proteasome accessory factor PafA2 [Kineosporia sp. NBRC 101677]